MPSELIVPVSPPPDIEVETWERSIDEIEARGPRRLCLPHFGVVEDANAHLAEMRRRLRTWSQRVRDGATEEEFVRAAEAEVAEVADADVAEAFTQAGPFWQSYGGLRRYWDKKGTQGAYA